MCKSWETGDLALRFKARFWGFERSGITLAVLWSTGVHGTRRRRPIKRCLHIFPNVFLMVVGLQSNFWWKTLYENQKQRSSRPPTRPKDLIFSLFFICFHCENEGKTKNARPVIWDFWWKSLYENQKKGLRQQKTTLGTSSFSLHLKDISRWSGSQWSTRATGRGPPGSTIIILKEIIRFNNNNNNNNHLTHGPPRFLPTRGSCRRGVLPPLRGGNSWTKESPVLPIPSYPALCREDTTSWNDGRPRTHHKQCHHQFKQTLSWQARSDHDKADQSVSS